MNIFLILALCLGSLVVLANDQVSADCETSTRATSRKPPRLSCLTVKCTLGARCKMINGQPRCVCNEMCTKIFDPVCGTDGKTYANECMLEVASCKGQTGVRVEHQGECASDNDESEQQEDENLA